MNKQEIEEKVKEIIETRMRPALQMDGGDISFEGLSDELVVNVRLHGACGTCPRAQMTLKMGVEAALKDAIPEIKSVEAVGF